MKRCGNCGGVNPESAQWCGQCHAPFDAPRVPTPPPPPPPEGPIPSAGSEEAVAPGGTVPAMEGHQRGAFVVTEEGVMWGCAVCGGRNRIELDVCGTCGTPFRETVVPKTRELRRSGSPATAAAISMMLPGAGHAYLGLWGQAVARAVIGLWVLATVITALSIEASGARMMAITFSVVAVMLWAVSAHDAAQEASGRPGAVLLKGRTFLWLVLGLLMLMMLQVVAAGMGGG